MTSSRRLRPGSLLWLCALVAMPFVLLRWFPVSLPELESRPLARSAKQDGPRFRRVASSESGVSFRNELRKENRYTYLTNGAGLAVGDYDKDGLPDLYCVSQDGPNKLFRQTAPLRFVDVTATAGNVDGGDAWGAGATFVDVDGDSWLDLYVCNTEAKNRLYKNRGDGTFEECAARFGLDVAAASTMAAFADADGDGDLDCYLVTNRALHAGWALVPEVLDAMQVPGDTLRTARQMVPSLQDTADPVFQRLQRGDQDPSLRIPEKLREHFFAFHGRVYMAGQRDRYLRNDGGTFTDGSDAAGFADHGMGLSATWVDYDQDGKPDLYIANDLESPDQLWHNEGGGRFREVAKETLPHTAYYGMGSDAGDVDGDGRMDLFVADMSATTHKMAKILMGDMNAQRDFLIHADPQQCMRNALLLNTGTNRFQEAAFLAGVASTDWTWSALFGDLDNDARLDLFCTNGIARFDMNPDIELEKQRLWRAGKQDEAIALIQSVPSVPEKNFALRNAGDLQFEKTGAAWGLDAATISHGALLVDLDRDGDLDVVTNDLDQELGLYENRTAEGHSIAFVLEGRGANTRGIGARIELGVGAQRLVRENHVSRGYLSGQEARVHFGLGSASKIDFAVVTWPSGSRQVLHELEADREYLVREPSSRVFAFEMEPPVMPMFSEVAIEAAPVHREAPFDDFDAQFLLPHQLSKLGPGVAVGDADGDGDDDVFTGGAAGQSGTLLRNDGARYVAVDGPWQQDAACEDMGILWLDHDGDGDQDLLVCSGGVEANEGDARLRDRIYRNDGSLRFVRDDAALPDIRTSSSSAAAADIDGDGDLDLAIGGRLVPGRFPDAPATRLYRNDGGRFVDATTEWAPSLLTAGMVTSVVFAPVDGDAWPDLLVAAQWQPIRYLRNRDGKGFEDQTEAAGLAAHSGQWNSLLPLDVDGDGDLDFLAGNLGKNTKYKTSKEHPLGLVFADFDGNGTRDLVETKYEGDRLLPVRGRSCSSQAMPFVAEKFPTYAQFASSLLGDIYPQDKLATAGRLECTTLQSSLLRNDGKGAFAVEPLPHRAQIAPVFGMATADFDGDGLDDGIAATNFFSPEPETGRFDGGTGLVLTHERAGDNSLLVVPPSRSGFVHHGDQKGLALTAGRDGYGLRVLVAQNGGALRAMDHSWADLLHVRLEGPRGNPTGVGARVTLHRQSGATESRWVTAGSGYLSQSTAAALFPASSQQPDAPQRVVVRWPDATEQTVPVDASTRILRVAHP